MTLRIAGRTGNGVEVPEAQVRPGQIVCLTAPSGAGKTRLMRAIADLEPSSLAASLDGTDREEVPAPAWRRRVAYLSPTPGWRSDLAAARLVEAPALALARTLGLEGDALARPVRELSTGQQQRLHLARLLAAPHDVLLLDEPCSALDVGARDAAEALIAAAAGRGARVLLSSHDPGAVARLGAGHWRIAAGTLEVS